MLKKFANRIKAAVIDRQRRATRKNAARAVIGQSRLFDPEWYVERYPDVTTAGMDPLDHFVAHGATEGRNPSERFDSRWYMKRHPDVARTGINPLLHYLQHGRDEGRSIRAVSKSREDEELERTASRRKKNQEEMEKAPPVDPYPSDFLHGWQARPVAWSALPAQRQQTAEQQPTAVLPGEPKSSADFLAATEQVPADVAARVKFFEWMRHIPLSRCPSGEAGHMPARPIAPDAEGLLASHGLGFERIADGWFVGSSRLMLRVHSPSTEVRRLRAFQIDKDGTPATYSVKQGQQLLCLSVEHEFCPVLLTWHADDETLIDSALIPFPSLFRGGLHYSEMAAVETLSDCRTSLPDYMGLLLSQAYGRAGQASDFVIGTIAINLQGANGSEPVFNLGTISALATRFGIVVEAKGVGDDQAARLLADRLRQPVENDAPARSAAAGKTFILPAHGLPTLAGLVARVGGLRLGQGCFCVVDNATRASEMLVNRSSGTTALNVLNHPALPVPFPIMEGSEASNGSFDAPVMIAYRDGKTWSVDELMPVSPDTPMPTSQPDVDKGPKPRITVIIDEPEPTDILALCLASLSHQTIADQLDIHLLIPSGAWPIDPGSLSDRLTIRSEGQEASRSERLNSAAAGVTSDYLLLLDSAICLPDRRTLAHLLDIARCAGVASVSCALVREDGVDGSIAVESTGYLEAGGFDVESPMFTARSAVANIFPASTYPVVANDLRLALIPTGRWRDLGGLNERADWFTEASLDFGLRGAAAHLSHHCTTLTRASLIGPPETSDETALPLPPSALPSFRAGSFTQIRKLR